MYTYMLLIWNNTLLHICDIRQTGRYERIGGVVFPAMAETAVGSAIPEQKRLFRGRLHIPRNVYGILRATYRHINPLAIDVEAGNPVFEARGNCLICRKHKKLVLGCSNSVIPTEGVEWIGPSAFHFFDYDAPLPPISMLIPDNIRRIEQDAFFADSPEDIHITVSAGVRSIGAAALLLHSGKLCRITFCGDPALEVGVFGTKAEAADTEYARLRAFRDDWFVDPQHLAVTAPHGSSVAAYCKKYSIPCEEV